MIFRENLKGTAHDYFLLDFVKIIIYFLIKFIYLSLKGRLSLKGNSRYKGKPIRKDGPNIKSPKNNKREHKPSRKNI